MMTNEEKLELAKTLMEEVGGFGFVPDTAKEMFANLYTSATEEKYQAQIAMLSEDGKRYQRLRIIGVAPYETKHLANGTVLRFQNLDGYCDAEIKAHPSRGEATQATADAFIAEIEARVLRADSPLQKLIAAHAEMLEANPYCYFELAYTRRTEWMAWLCSKPQEDDPGRIVLAKGQGSTPEEAAIDALEFMAAEKRKQAEQGEESGK